MRYSNTLDTLAHAGDLCGFYVESPAEREERDASLAGMFDAPDASFEEAMADAREAAREIAEYEAAMAHLRTL